MSIDRFKKFHALLKVTMKDFEVKYKDKSTFMKILGYILFFNKAFMTSFTTTVGSTVYFPSEAGLEKRGNGAMSTLAHEYQHVKDADSVTGVVFGFAYLIPQILAPLMLLFGFINWWLAIGLFVLFLAPIPAPLRMYYELRGYKMSLFMTNLFLTENGVREEDRLLALKEQAKRHNKQFTSFNYYLMWPFGVLSKLEESAEKIVDGRIMMEDEIYSEVEDAFKRSK